MGTAEYNIQNFFKTVCGNACVQPYIQPVVLEKLKFPFLIASTPNKLFGEDSKHSSNVKLPDQYSDRDGSLYTIGKEELLSELISLMEWGATGETSEKFATEMANYFFNNKSYSLSNTYTNADLIETIRNTAVFKRYVDQTEAELKKRIKNNNGIIEQNEFIIPQGDWYSFHFQKEFENYHNGLIITIDQVSYIEVELNAIKYLNGIVSELETTFILYDTYGLDNEDLKKFGLLSPGYLKSWKEFGNRNIKQQTLSTGFGWSFNCWWVLQYYYNCAPFISKLRIENVKMSVI